jgi:glycosyltransferase involved in cell wall biosynthesis
MLFQQQNKKRIALMLPSYAEHDAMGNYVKIFSDIFENAGYQTQIFARFCDKALKNQVKTFDEYKEADFDLLNFHHGIGDMIADVVKNSTIPVLLYYHNITPARYYLDYNMETFQLLLYGREQLKDMAENTTYALSASNYSDEELKQLGFKAREIMPIFFDTAKLEQLKTDTKTVYKMNNQKYTNISFIGRFSAHKDQETLVKAFYIYKNHYNQNSKLNLVGSVFEKTYFDRVKALVKELGLEEDVNITGKVSEEVWKAYFTQSCVVVSLSEHEGFFVPALEANFFKVPIIAYNGGAVKDTVAEAGIVMDDKSPAFVAGMIDKVVKDEDLRKKLIENGKENYKKYDQKLHEGKLLEIVQKII